MNPPNVKDADQMVCPCCGHKGLSFAGWQAQHPDPGHWYAKCPKCTESACANEDLKHIVVKPDAKPVYTPAFLTSNQMDPDEQEEHDEWCKEVARGSKKQ